MKNLILLIAIVGIGVFSHAQGHEFETDAFHAIHVSSAFEVYLEQHDEYSVTAEVPKEMTDDLDIYVKNGALHVGMKEGYKKNSWWKSKNDDILVHITFPSIDELHVSGAVELDAKNVLKLEDLHVDASGASEIHFHIKCDDLSIDLSGASELSLDVYADNFALETSGASNVVVTGETDNFKIECSGASDIDADRFAADDVSIDCSGASSIHTWVKDDITIKASGTSDIKYKCDGCDDREVHTTGASSVKKY